MGPGPDELGESPKLREKNPKIWEFQPKIPPGAQNFGKNPKTLGKKNPKYWGRKGRNCPKIPNFSPKSTQNPGKFPPRSQNPGKYSKILGNPPPKTPKSRENSPKFQGKPKSFQISPKFTREAPEFPAKSPPRRPRPFSTHLSRHWLIRGGGRGKGRSERAWRSAGEETSIINKPRSPLIKRGLAPLNRD